MSPASDGCEEPVNPDRHMVSRRARVLTAWLNLRLARPPRRSIPRRLSYGWEGLYDEGFSDMAAWRRAIELSLGETDLEKLRLIARSRTEAASRVERARILLGLGKLVVFRGGPSARAAPSNGPALRRAGGGRRPDGRAGRSPSARPGAFDHAGSESLVDIAVVPEGEGTELSARIVDHAAARPPCSRARSRRRAPVPGKFGAGHVCARSSILRK